MKATSSTMLTVMLPTERRSLCPFCIQMPRAPISYPSDPTLLPLTPPPAPAHQLTISDYFAHGFEEVVALGRI